MKTNNLNKTSKEILLNIQNNHNFNFKKQTEVLEHVLNFYNMFNEVLTEEDCNLMNETFKKLPKTFSVEVIKKIRSISKELIEVDTANNLNKNHLNSRSASDMRANDFLNKLLEVNNSDCEWFEKLYISQTSFKNTAKKWKEIGKTEYTFSDTVIKRCLERNNKIIEENHTTNNLDVKHNLKANKEMVKQKTKQ